MSGARKKPRRRRRKVVPRTARATTPRADHAGYVTIPGTARRLRSRNVALGAIGVLVVGGFLAYTAVEDRHCVDANNRVVADSNCSGHGGSGYRWYYGGGERAGKMTGGSFERGGFGRIFGGFHGG